MARKYRVKQKADEYYPQYKSFLFWSYFYDDFVPKSGWYKRYGKVYFYDFKKASDWIREDKRKRFTKTTIVH